MAIRLSDLSATKLLWFGYILLYLALAYLGLALARIADRLSLADGFLLLIVMLLPMLVSILVSIYWFIRLIWLVIAYDPETHPIPQKKRRLVFTWVAILFIFDSSSHYLTRYKPPIYMSEITFHDPVIAVQDSMMTLRHIMATIDSDRFVSCYIRRQDSTLVFVSPQMDSVEHTFKTWGHIDTVTATNAGLRFVPPADRARLISLLRFLNRNLISGIRHDTSIGFWLYAYGVTSEDNDVWRRDLLIYDTPADTLHPAFHYYLKPHDRKQRIVLVSHNRVPFVFFR